MRRCEVISVLSIQTEVLEYKTLKGVVWKTLIYSAESCLSCHEYFLRPILIFQRFISQLSSVHAIWVPNPRHSTTTASFIVDFANKLNHYKSSQCPTNGSTRVAKSSWNLAVSNIKTKATSARHPGLYLRHPGRNKPLRVQGNTLGRFQCSTFLYYGSVALYDCVQNLSLSRIVIYVHL